MKELMRYLSMIMLMLLAPGWLCANASYDIFEVKKELTQESKQDGRAVIESENQRERIVRHFTKKLGKIDDLGLGDVESNKNQGDLAELKKKIQVLINTYQTVVRPILLNNIYLKRKDIGEKMNKMELSKLVFPTRYNHKTRKPIAGIFSYKQDIDDSLFGEHWVNAGLLVSFPKIAREIWVQDALKMDAELIAFWRIHIAYMDGIATKKLEIAKQSDVKIDPAHVKPQLNDWSEYKREKVVRKFVRKMQKLDGMQSWESFKQDLKSLLETYEYTIKPILIDNVNQHRFDIGAKANKGDLISLFYPHKRNYKTGNPVASKLSHKEDGRAIGYLINNPTLQDDGVVKQALNMEEELKKLLDEHRSYFKYDRSVMY